MDEQQELLDAVVAEATQAVEQKPTSFIRVERFDNYVKAGLLMEEPQELIPHVIVEHETTILFGDTGLGKSTLSMQMAIEIAKTGKNVLYVNFELSQQQFSKNILAYRFRRLSSSPTSTTPSCTMLLTRASSLLRSRS